MSATRTIVLADVSPDPFFRLSFPLQPGLWSDLARRLPGFPLLIIDQNDRLIFGHDYLLHLRRSAVRTAPALVSAETDEKNLGLAFQLKLKLAGINLFEKLTFICKYMQFASLAKIQQAFPTGIPLNETNGDEILRLLHPRYKALLIAGRIGFRTLLEISRTAPDDRDSLLVFFSQVRFNENQQGKILEMLKEIQVRDCDAYGAILERTSFSTLGQREMPQKQILDGLSRIRFPAFSQTLDVWREMAQKRCGSRCDLTPHPYFEKKEVQLTIRCRDLQEALQIIEKCKNLIVEPESP